ncbi:MAG: cobalamin-dependent protein, partial [Chlorobium sp.]|nr:cobalamin-dependent protein [Chlorobium sp.]
ELFQKSMYRVGELWEINEISVAREHLATTITESMLSITYPHLFTGLQSAKKAIISCTANEYHQLGGKMVADIFELHGWDTHFLGVNTPINELLACIDEIKPDLIGLSLAVYFNVAA